MRSHVYFLIIYFIMLYGEWWKGKWGRKREAVFIVTETVSNDNYIERQLNVVCKTNGRLTSVKKWVISEQQVNTNSSGDETAPSVLILLRGSPPMSQRYKKNICISPQTWRFIKKGIPFTFATYIKRVSLLL